MSGLSVHAEGTGGVPLSQAQRKARLNAASEATGIKFPVSDLLSGSWPFMWDERRMCWHQPTPQIVFEGQSRRVIELVIEAAWGLTIESPWYAGPHHCGDADCLQVRHWVVNCPVDALDKAIPPERKCHQGFRAIADDDWKVAAKHILSIDDWPRWNCHQLQRDFPGHSVHTFHRVHSFLLISERNNTKWARFFHERD